MDKTISQLDSLPGGTLATDALFEVEQAGGSYKATGAQVATLAVSGGVPNFQSWLQTQTSAGILAQWRGGDVYLPSPCIITLPPTGLHGWGLDLGGARVFPNYTNVADDLIRFQTGPGVTSAPNYIGGRISNGTLFGVNSSGTPVVRRLLSIDAPIGAQGAIWGGNVSNMRLVGSVDSNLWMHGGVFEYDVTDCVSKNAGNAGAEIRNSTAGVSEVISSIKFKGGDYRENQYGILSSADTTYQEANGFYVDGIDFIVNRGPAVYSIAGVKLVRGCHFENNCAAGGAFDAAIWAGYGSVTTRDNDFTGNLNVQKSAVEVTFGIGGIDMSGDVISGDTAVYLKASGGGTTAILDHYMNGTSNGAWTIAKRSVTSSVPAAGAF